MRAQQRKGARGEVDAAKYLARLGVEMIVKVETPTHFVNGRAIRYKKADADLNGIYPKTGQRVLAEVKAHDGDTLPWSEFRPHQPARLTANDGYGGMSFIIWVHSSGVYVLRWPIPGFDRPKTSIKLFYAQRMNLVKEP